MNWQKHFLTIVAVMALVAVVFTLRRGCAGVGARGPIRPADAQIVEVALEGLPVSGRLSPSSFALQAELADTQDKRRRGLAGRPGLEPGFAMLYVYDQPQQLEFAWQQTPVELSVAFLREDRTIAHIHHTAANDLVSFTPDEPVKYVLEMRRGWFADRGVEVGARFELPENLTGAARPEAHRGGAEDTGND